MIILGIDPGYAKMGYGVIEINGNHLESRKYGAVTTSSGTDMAGRLKHIYSGLEEIIYEFEPEAASIEELFFNTNSKTALLAAQARGVAILACANSGVPVFEYTPLQIKQALVGYGRAEKVQVQEMVKTILNMHQIPKPDDAADALAAAICHWHSSGRTAKARRVHDVSLY